MSKRVWAPQRPGWVAGCAVLAASMVLGACGSSGARPSSGGSSQSQPPIAITIGDTAIGAGYSDIYVGIDDGIYRKYGLDVTLKKLNTGPQLVPALLGGSVQIAVGPANSAAAAILKGNDLRFIALSEAHFNLQMWGDKDITSPQDLVGKKVGVTSPGSESDIGLTAYLKEQNLTGKVERVHTGSIPAMFAALYSGAINVVTNQPPQGNATAAKGYHLIADLSSLPFAVGAYTVTAQYAASHADVLKRFAEAEVAILKYLRSNPDQTVAAIEKNSGVSSSSDAKYAYNFFLKVWTEQPTVQVPLITQAFQLAAAKDNVAAPSGVSEYIDNSFVQAALKSGS